MQINVQKLFSLVILVVVVLALLFGDSYAYNMEKRK